MTENLNKKPPKGILKTSSSLDTASSVSSPNVGNSSARRNSGVVNSDKNELLPEDDDAGGGGSAPESYLCVRKHSKTAKFDEMNILETYHPATKTYGHMKIEEPKTPFSYYEDADEELEPSSQGAAHRSKESIDADELASKLEETAKRGTEQEEPEIEEESEEEEEDQDPESKASRIKFESKRKAHYNEYYAVKLARKLMEQEEDDDEVKGDGPPENHDSEKFIPEEETLVDEELNEEMQDA